VELANTDSQPKGWLFGFFKKLKKIKLATKNSICPGGLVAATQIR
jgi:hypothetical protein